MWSMTVRQTNVVWMAFILAVSVLSDVRAVEKQSGKEKGEGDSERSDPLLGEVLALCEYCLYYCG